VLPVVPRDAKKGRGAHRAQSVGGDNGSLNGLIHPGTQNEKSGKPLMQSLYQLADHCIFPEKAVP
jgi:hypothetical protein